MNFDPLLEKGKKLKDHLLLTGNLSASLPVSLLSGAGAATIASTMTNNNSVIVLSSMVGEFLGFHGTYLTLSYFNEEEKRRREQKKYKKKSLEYLIKSEVCGGIRTPLRFLSMSYFLRNTDPSMASVASQSLAFIPYTVLMNFWMDKPLFPEKITEKIKKSYHSTFINLVDIVKYNPVQ